MGHLLGNATGSLWRMQNGYVLAAEAGLTEITETLQSMSETDRDELRCALQNVVFLLKGLNRARPGITHGTNRSLG